MPRDYPQYTDLSEYLQMYDYLSFSHLSFTFIYIILFHDPWNNTLHKIFLRLSQSRRVERIVKIVLENVHLTPPLKSSEIIRFPWLRLIILRDNGCYIIAEECLKNILRFVIKIPFEMIWITGRNKYSVSTNVIKLKEKIIEKRRDIGTMYSLSIQSIFGIEEIERCDIVAIYPISITVQPFKSSALLLQHGGVSR